MRGWHNAGLGRRMNCFVLLMPFSEKGWVWTAFLKLSVSAPSLSLSCLRLCCVPASGPEPLTAPGLWCSPAVPPPPRNPIGWRQAGRLGRLGQCGSGGGMKVSGAVRGHLHTEPSLCLQLQPQLCTLTALWTSVSATITRSTWPLSLCSVRSHSLTVCVCTYVRVLVSLLHLNLTVDCLFLFQNVLSNTFVSVQCQIWTFLAIDLLTCLFCHVCYPLHSGLNHKYMYTLSTIDVSVLPLFYIR